MSAVLYTPMPIRPIVRLAFWPVLFLSIANGAYLYFFSSHAAEGYAWPVRPAASAAFMGAGYLAGVVSAVMSIFGARYWRSLNALIPGFTALAVVLSAATFIHADRFRWDYPLTWGWTAVYVALPFAGAWAWWMHTQGAASQPSARDPGLRPLRAVFLIAGAATASMGFAMCCFPSAFIEVWPWQLTVLMARVFGAWYFLNAAILLYSAAAARQPHELPIPSVALATFNLASLLIPLLHAGDMRHSATLFWPWVLLHLSLGLCAVWATIRGLALMRRSQQRQ
jgi:hypothetical protein